MNRRLVETLGKIQRQPTDFLHPVQIHFDNSFSTSETVLDIRSADTPAFLYTFTNALTMRGIYVEKAKIEVKGTEVHNRLFIRGKRIVKENLHRMKKKGRGCVSPPFIARDLF